MDDTRATADNSHEASPLSRAVIIAVLAASLMVGAFAITNQSYWIDEALSLIVAMAPDPAEAWKYAQAVSGSTLQMPLYQVYLYGWHKIFGGGEWAMRASNIPWFVLGQLAFLVLLRHRPKLALIACLLAVVSPIVWMYLDEARPYIMQYAAACWMIAALARLSTPGPRNSPTDTPPLSDLPSVPSVPPTLTTPGHASLVILPVAAAAIVLFASSLLGVLWAAAFTVALLMLARRDAGTLSGANPRNLWLIGLTCLALLAAFATYYTLTWSDAGRGYHRSGLSLLSLPFIAYELLGFSGFGPGKIEMRLAPVRSVLQALPALLPLAFTLGLLLVFGARQFLGRQWNRTIVIAWTVALGAPLLVMFVAMFLFDHRPLPRHVIPVLPALLLGLAAIIESALTAKSVFWRALAILLPLLWLGSALNLRWQARHAKDDYRTAAALAAAALADNKEVWWAADAAAAYIYLTPVALEEVPGRAWAMQAPAWDDIRFKLPPRVIVISKPDIYDPQGAVARYASENQFAAALSLQTFTIFTRHGEPLPAIVP